MTIEFELFEQGKRRARRRGFFFGIVLMLILFGVFYLVKIMPDIKKNSPHIARIKVSGLIYDDFELNNHLIRLAKNDTVKAVILHINSPGGSVVGAEATYLSLAKLTKNKPTVSVLGETAASGGYLIALATNFIVARGNTLTGSVGVIVQYPNFSEFLNKLGVSINTLKSSDLKASFNFYEKPTKDAIEKHKQLIDETFIWFKDLVEKERNLSGKALDKISTGKVFTGRMAVKIGLVDQIGGEEEAIEYLTKKNLNLENLPVLDWNFKVDSSSLWDFFHFPQDISLLKTKLLENQGPRLYSILF